MNTNIVRRNLILMYGVDVFFAVSVPFALFAMLGMPFTQKYLGIYAGIMALRSATGISGYWWLSTPIRSWASTPEKERSATQIVNADLAVQLMPSRFAAIYGSTWALALVILSWIYVMLDATLLGPRSMNVTVFVVIAEGLGSAAFALPLMRIAFTSLASDLSLEQARRGIPNARPTTSIAGTIGFIAVCLAVAPLSWACAIIYTSATSSAISEIERKSEIALWQTASRIASDGPSVIEQAAVPMLFVTNDGRVTGQSDVFPPDWQKRVEKAGSGRTVFERDLSVITARLPQGHLLALADARSAEIGNAILAIVLMLVIIVIWAPLCAYLISMTVTKPLGELRHVVTRLVEEGKLKALGTIPIPRNDEVGQLAARFNALLNLLRSISESAAAVAEGRLTETPAGEGDLPEAFRGMIYSLEMMVRQISETSVQLAAAATEIFAASQEQEASATSQSAAITEISRTMESLATAAAHVSSSVAGVLGNAERTLDTTDQMVGRISELNGHAHRIGEILEVIRDISDRSDLLALNGSLEASRAGDAGRGFAVVAAEMRRLAERVTASVSTVKGLVSDIRASGSSTVMATEESKKLASETTDAARQINRVIQQQLSGTEQVSASVKDVAQVLTQVAAATTQTRASAEDLKRRAESLASLVSRFALSDAAEAHR